MRKGARWAAAAAVSLSGPLMVGAAAPAHAATLPGCPAATGERIEDTPATFRRTVALTFDDGPSETWTPRVLALLAKHHVHGTFFVVGRRAAMAPDMLQKIIDAGNVVGNHTWDHPTTGNGMYDLTAAQLATELDPTSAMISDFTGLPVCFFRAPQGKDHTPTIRTLAKSRGMVVTGFHTASDYQQPTHLDPAWVKLIEQRLENIGPHPVLLLHDGGTFRANSVAALDQIITWYASRGYVFTDPAGRPFPDDPKAAGHVPATGWALPPSWTPPDGSALVDLSTGSTPGQEPTPGVTSTEQPSATITGSQPPFPSAVTGTATGGPSDLPSPLTFTPATPTARPSKSPATGAPLARLAAKGRHDPVAARTVMDALTRYLMVFSSPPA